MKSLLLAIIIFTIFLLSAGYSSAETIRVAILESQRSVSLSAQSGLVRDGAAADRAEKKMLFQTDSIGTTPVRLRTNGEFIQVNGSSYRGALEVRRQKNGLLLVVNELDLESYLRGVVAAEIPYEWEVETLKAQAVAARTYALYQKQEAGKRPFHMRATVGSQVYLGKRGERPSTDQAIRETAGLVLEYRGEIISAFFHSSCGGHTEDAFELWGIDAPYLKGVDCECQRISRYGLWEKRFQTSAVAVALGRSGFRMNGITEVELDSITPAGRVRSVSFRDRNGSVSVPAETLRAVVGYARLPSVFFEAEVLDGEVVFSGRGLGHGVGMCQWGAREMAQRGFDFCAILGHYYPGTKMVKRK